jgi:hypothetical protein
MKRIVTQYWERGKTDRHEGERIVTKKQEREKRGKGNKTGSIRIT